MKCSVEMEVSGLHSYGTAASAGLTTPFFVLSKGDATVLPVKSGSVLLYTANVITTDDSLTVTPTAAAGTITVNGVTVATGVASAAIPLSVGPNEITVVVFESGKHPVTYRIIVTRASS